MAADMLHGDANVVGSVTSGGTESILCAIKTYRDRARNLYPYITQPEMVCNLYTYVCCVVYAVCLCYCSYCVAHMRACVHACVVWCGCTD